MSEGWSESAPAWIASIDGDFSRHAVLDAPMLARVRAGGYGHALDVGCGEGRFCRMMRAAGVNVVGVDPIPLMVETAQARDPGGDYRVGRAEKLDFPDASFDLAVSYLTLIDIEGLEQAVAEMARVLRPRRRPADRQSQFILDGRRLGRRGPCRALCDRRLSRQPGRMGGLGRRPRAQLASAAVALHAGAAGAGAEARLL